MNYQLKNVIEGVLGIGDIIDRAGIGASNYGDLTTRDLMRYELMQFLGYLGLSDGKISWEEAQFISDYLDFNLNPRDFQKYVMENGWYSTDFEQQVPVSLKLFVAADLAMGDVAENKGSELLCSLYETIGREYIAIDDEINESELNDFLAYTAMLREYVRENLYKQGNTAASKPESEASGTEDDEKTLEELLEDLNSLIGLASVKNDVNSLINLLKIRKIREERGLSVSPMSLHMVFSGNPGTGKTTVARLLAQIYNKLGILSKGHLTEVDRSGLVGGYVGQTALKVQEVVSKAKGGILFIDEAYSLTVNKGENDYGFEAIDTLLKAMEDNRDDLIVIVAGYPNLMEEFLSSNPGLRSRFNKFINFEDYKPDELFAIFESMLAKSNLTLDEDANLYAKKFFERRYFTRSTNFANGRDVRNFFEMALVNQANRLACEENLSDEDLSRITLEDLESIAI